MRVGLLQLNSKIASVEENYLNIRKAMVGAASTVDLFVSSELALLGYPPRDLLSQTLLLNTEAAFIEKLRLLTQELKCGLILGHTLKNNGLGKPLFNGASVFDSGKNLGFVKKHSLPSYDIFEEDRFFEGAAETDSNSFEFRGCPIELSICEDHWKSVAAFGVRDIRRYRSTTATTKTAPQLLINISASPFTVGKVQTREDLFSSLAQRSHCAVVYANCVGGQDDILFDGHSFFIQPDGNCAARAKGFGEDLLVAKLQDGEWLTKNAPTPVSSPNSWEQLHHALVMGIRDYVNKTGFKKVVLGLSGGIDSALCALLAVDALGAGNVEGLSLPSALTSKDSLREAALLARSLKIGFREIPIGNVLEAAQADLKLESHGLAYENLQSRTRGLLLMAISNSESKLLLSTANKSELALGYSTLYGDMCGALMPLGDVYKTEVYGLAHFLCRDEERIPLFTRQREPTAELATGQKDSDNMPPYEVLDGLLFELIENQGSTVFSESSWKQILGLRFTVEEMRRRFHAAEFKRRQSPPILKIHQRSFGMGWRMPLAKNNSLGSAT